jgi:hypothetical protein
MPRWINVKAPFEFNIRGEKGRGIVSTIAFRQEDVGDHFVKDEIADYAVKGKFASEGKHDPDARSKKGGPKARRASRPRAKRSTEKAAADEPARETRASKAANKVIDETSADLQPADRLDGARLAEDGGASDSADASADAS